MTAKHDENCWCARCIKRLLDAYDKYFKAWLHNNGTGESGMSFEQWKTELAIALGKTFAMDGAEYIRQTGDECWREMFDDGLTPAEAAEEEAYAAVTSQ